MARQVTVRPAEVRRPQVRSGWDALEVFGSCGIDACDPVEALGRDWPINVRVIA